MEMSRSHKLETIWNVLHQYREELIPCDHHEDAYMDGYIEEGESYPDVDHEDLEDHGYYRESCDNAEIAHKDYWYPEVDKCQPHAKALRDAIEADDGKATWELLLIMLREA